MKDIKLSPRLETILEALGVVKTLADVGCDHGFISIAAVLRGKCENAIAMDINEGPLASAKMNAGLYGVKDAVTLRLSDGLMKVEPGEVDGIIIAGMGGLLVRDILVKGEAVCKAAKRLVLSPQSDIDEVRKYLLSSGYKIADEECLIDEEKFYFVIVAEPSEAEVKGIKDEESKGQMTYDKAYPCGEAGIMFGGILIKKRHPILLKFLRKRIILIDDILSKKELKGSKREKELLAEKAHIDEAMSYYKV